MTGDKIQGALYAALSGSTALAAVMGGAVRVFDHVPDGARFPYLTIGDEQSIDDGTDCGEASEVFADVHVWSRDDAQGRVEAKRIAAIVRPLLAQRLPVPPDTIVVGEFRSARHFMDPDGQTAHGVLTFRYLVEHEV